MAFGIHSKQDGAYGVIVDIGSGSVGVGIIASAEDASKPICLYAHREHIDSAKTRTPDEHLRLLHDAIFSAALHFRQEGLRALHAYSARARLSRMLVVCAAPWSHTATHLIHLAEETPFTITKEHIDRLVTASEKEERTAVRALDLFKDTDLEIADRSIINTVVNGYTVDEPYGRRAVELTLAHLSGIVPKKLSDTAQKLTEAIPNAIDQSVHTYALVLYCTVRDLYPHTSNFLTTDITGTATEIGLVQDGILYETISVPFGAYTFMQRLAKELHTIPEEAWTHMCEYGTKDMAKKVTDAITVVKSEYQTVLSEAYAKLSKTYVLPSQTFFTTHNGVEPLFKQSVAGAQKREDASIVAIDTDASKDFSIFADGVTTDTYIAITAYFFHKLHGCGEITKS